MHMYKVYIYMPQCELYAYMTVWTTKVLIELLKKSLNNLYSSRPETKDYY